MWPSLLGVYVRICQTSICKALGDHPIKCLLQTNKRIQTTRSLSAVSWVRSCHQPHHSQKSILPGATHQRPTVYPLQTHLPIILQPSKAPFSRSQSPHHHVVLQYFLTTHPRNPRRTRAKRDTDSPVWLPGASPTQTHTQKNPQKTPPNSLAHVTQNHPRHPSTPKPTPSDHPQTDLASRPPKTHHTTPPTCSTSASNTSANATPHRQTPTTTQK